MKENQTYSELLQRFDRQLFQLDIEFRKHILDFAGVADDIPGFIHINTKKELTVVYANKQLYNFLNIEPDDIERLQQIQLVSIHPETIRQVTPSMFSFLSRGDDHEVFPFYQAIKRGGNAEYELFYSSCKSFADKAIVTIANPVNELVRCTKKLARIIEENEFQTKNWDKFHSLTKREKQVLSLVSLGFTNAEISDRLYISALTVKTHRKNIFKKLDARHISELIKYAYAFDLI